jgi:hypothetical protein
MTQPLEFRFALTRDEFVRGARAFYLRQRSTWFFLAVLTLFGIVNWVMFDLPALPLILGTLLPLILYILVLFVVMPWLMGRQVQRNERLRVEMTWRVSDDRISVTTAHAESSMDWGTFRKVITTPDSYLLIFAINKNMFQIVPKRALTPEQIPEFEQLLAQKLSAARAAAA